MDSNSNNNNNNNRNYSDNNNNNNTGSYDGKNDSARDCGRQEGPQAPSGKKLKNRSKMDIIYDILVTATAGVKKTHIMSKANLSSEQMDFYFNALLHHRLLGADRDSEDNPIYRTTHKGVRFLECCAQIKSLISPSVRVRARGDPQQLMMFS